MKIIKYISLALILFNLPSFGLMAFGDSIGSLLSYGTIFMVFIYYALEKKSEPNWWIIIISILYFVISSLQYYGTLRFFLLEIVKFFVFIIAGYELIKRVSNNELFVFFIIGALSVGIEALFFTSDFGRYAGFYLNANVAGFICIYGYSVTYGLKNNTLKLFGQFVFTLMGLLTFSRTFIVIWLLLNIISLKISIKNIRIFGVGFLIFATLLFIDQVVGLNNPRFEQLKNIVNNENVSSEEISEDSRTETWALFYDQIFESPIIGSGYGTFSGKNDTMGVHNTYLMIIGEAGILPFLLFLIYISYLFFKSYVFFKEAPFLIMQTISLSVFLLANHNFFTFYYMTFASMWIQYQIYKLNNQKDEDKFLEV
ncbi:O-antigen ligase family protein [Winogradskyella pacifica]|uniref:O-antigen ligase family protein n=1 Tax=Winogradskyella pacifica TaxID=664642 RepID=UPI0015CC3EEA|nr:O-antigen ligase family protein [Winogradskyella pacifica]